jgi:hypothetical protein
LEMKQDTWWTSITLHKKTQLIHHKCKNYIPHSTGMEEL